MQRIDGKTGGEPQAGDGKNLCQFPVGLVLVGLLAIAASVKYPFGGEKP